MRILIIDGEAHEFEDGINLIQACEEVGVEIPRFCYHERLSIAGNCRMCLVEVKGMPKPVASCAMTINELRPGPNGEPPEIITKSASVKKAREGVMEFLLINHPLDCPICDQGGECDLQDQAMAYGVDTSRFDLNKRAVEDKNVGPLVKTMMTRCIHCTRCVRFMTEVAGVEELGAIGRGEDMEITTYLEQGMRSELSGNVIDLCPVGALTSKPYAFAARPWELTKTETIDVMDAVGSNIRVDARGSEVMRILPAIHDGVNEEWISDKTRFVWDGLRTQRLDQPYVREGDSLKPASWDEAFLAISAAVENVKADECAAIVGDLNAVEEIFALKDLTSKLGWKNIDCRQDGSPLDPIVGRGSYIFNSTMPGIDDADAILLIGSNPRLEASVLNARIRRRWKSGQCNIGLIGAREDLNYDFEYLGAGPQTLRDIASGASSFFEILKNAERPMIIVGGGVTAREDAQSIIGHAVQLAQSVGAIGNKDWIGFNVLQQAAARVGALDLGFVPGQGGKGLKEILQGASDGAIRLVYLLGADEIDMDALGDAFVIYQGSHGDKGAHRADVILPGAAYPEKNGTYVNLDGRVQMARRSSFPPGDAKEDWAILRALSAVLGKQLAYDSITALRASLFEVHPHFAAIDQISGVDPSVFDRLAAAAGDMSDESFQRPINDFYLTNPIARASAVMAEQAALAALNAAGGSDGTGGATGTDG